MSASPGDWFAADPSPMTLEGALERILPRLPVLVGTEAAPLDAARSRILAEDLVAAIDVPGADNSAVDGYALHIEDLDPRGETRLPVVGRAAAGHPYGTALPRGAALRIFTGALMPAGPDTVVMQEDCRREGDLVVIPPGVKRGSNRRKAGEDVRAGATALAAGARLRPQDIGLAAALGRATLTVAKPLRVALLSGPEPQPHDADRLGLRILLGQLGVAVLDRGALPTDPDALAAAHDAIVVAGAVPGGAEDPMAATLGLHIWHLAIEPASAVAFGELRRDGRALPAIGLPADPAAAMVALLCLARPILLRLMGARDLTPRRYRLRAGFAHTKDAGRRAFLPARLVPGPQSDLAAVANPAPSGRIAALLAADGLVDLPEALTRLEPGSMVDFLPFSEVA